jgi:hypothetical protein
MLLFVHALRAGADTGAAKSAAAEAVTRLWFV